MSEFTSDPNAALTAEAERETVAEHGDESAISTDASFGIGELVADREPTDGNANTAVVVNCPPQPASEWTVYGDTTVAEDNPDYPEDDSVVVVVYRSELDRYDPGWADRDDLDPYPLTDFNEAGLSYYSFPASRLKPLPNEEETATEGNDDIEEGESDANSGRMSRITHENTMTRSTQVAAESLSGPDPEPDRDGREVRKPEDESREPTDAALQLKERLEDGGMTVEIEADGRTLAAEKLGETYRVQPGGDVLEGDGLFAAKLERIATEVESQR